MTLKMRRKRAIAHILGHNTMGMKYLRFSHEELTFAKKGIAIIESLESKITELGDKAAEAKKRITEICKRREIDPKEVIEAGSDEKAISTYSTKMESNLPAVGRMHTNAVVRELQEDMANLRIYGAEIEENYSVIADLRRIQRNIEPTREFQLSFETLTRFGF